MTYPCISCNRDDGYPICLGDERCSRAAVPQPAVDAAVARVAARLATDPEFAKSLLPSMTHAEVKAALQKRPA